MYPTDRFYSSDHEWVEIDGQLCTVGITRYAQEELGEVVFVDLPDVGESFEAGEEIGTIESVKAVVEVYAPVSGTVVEVNTNLDDNPELLNSNPHDSGWLVKLRAAGEPYVDDLMRAPEYQAFLEE